MRFSKQAELSPNSEDVALEARLDAMIAARVEAAVSERFADELPKMKAAVFDSMPNWFKRVPILSRREFAARFIEEHCQGYEASLGRDDVAHFYLNGKKVGIPDKALRDSCRELAKALDRNSFDSLWGAAAGHAEQGADDRTWSREHPQEVAEELIRQGREFKPRECVETGDTQ